MVCGMRWNDQDLLGTKHRIPYGFIEEQGMKLWSKVKPRKIGWTSAYQVDYFLQNPTGPRCESRILLSNPHLGSQKIQVPFFQWQWQRPKDDCKPGWRREANRSGGRGWTKTFLISKKSKFRFFCLKIKNHDRNYRATSSIHLFVIKHYMLASKWTVNPWNVISRLQDWKDISHISKATPSWGKWILSKFQYLVNWNHFCHIRCQNETWPGRGCSHLLLWDGDSRGKGKYVFQSGISDCVSVDLMFRSK